MVFNTLVDNGDLHEGPPTIELSGCITILGLVACLTKSRELGVEVAEGRDSRGLLDAVLDTFPPEPSKGSVFSLSSSSRSTFSSSESKGREGWMEDIYAKFASWSLP